ncbi:MAG: hypothetical protein R3C52_04560 [Hyphomonadaceae bacterium]
MPIVWLLFAIDAATARGLLLHALEEVEPPPSLRASFQATITSDDGIRQIAFDPYAAPDQRFRVIGRRGDSEELDAIVDSWRAEGQADARLFADDLRASLGDVRLFADGARWAIQFRHRISPNDGPVDQLISSRMVGNLELEEATGRLKEVSYQIEHPVKLETGATLYAYRQTYHFTHSDRWGVSFVSSYDLEARGGRWGVQESREVHVRLDAVRFALASDANQDLETRVVQPERPSTVQYR